MANIALQPPKANIALQTRPLKQSSGNEEYEVYKSGLEWDLTDPIIIDNRDDLKSESRWKGRLDPYHHQVTNLITFCRRLPVTLLADDVGLGKTISAGLIVSELIARGRLTKVLIVCPKLLGPQWKEELESKFDIPARVVTGKELVRADFTDCGAIITTYNSARLYLDDIPHDRFQMLILDEAHKLRNLYGVENPPQVAVRFQAALQERRFRFVLMLTATPIQNRLWDLYSLVDLLTVGRGHINPFGSPGIFARKFIADNREDARQLKLDARDEFRSIVYGYMSRVRRQDARLYFPERVVQMHEVLPTESELKLIAAIAKPIQNLNRLVQISILQALTSSPDALLAQITNMHRNGTVPPDLLSIVRSIVVGMPLSAKLRGLGELIARLKQESPEKWRLVIFTTRIETQTTIQAFLERLGLAVGIINGSSGSRNQDTLAAFRKNPPICHVIVSTEAGSEGVNLQVANVLVNFDLPWNPMVVEQRIGRIQRLASDHASVAIFNIVLKGTFEEYIVGRLMEKLQLASHAIGDIESLLEASGLDGDDGASFDEQIRRLVLAALQGRDIELATRKAVESIEQAKITLESESENISDLLGDMNGAEKSGPRAPKLPEMVRALTYQEFSLRALMQEGAQIVKRDSNQALVIREGRREHLNFNPENTYPNSFVCAPGSPYFSRLVDRVIASGVCRIKDADSEASPVCEQLIRDWLSRFSGAAKSYAITNIKMAFEGEALVRVRATVAHDSYERLVGISCNQKIHNRAMDRPSLAKIPSLITNCSSIGINQEAIVEEASNDDGILEFSRFYLERREIEVDSAAGDDRKRQKLFEEFTPRLEMTLVGLDGVVKRRIKTEVTYRLADDSEYSSFLVLLPSENSYDELPLISTCSVSGNKAPQTCFEECQISGKSVLRHLLVRSEVSGRYAMPEYVAYCEQTGKKILRDEGKVSDLTGKFVSSTLLKTSHISGKVGESHLFSACDFTNAVVCSSELLTSDFSAKRFRFDHKETSALSNKIGHKSEFTLCPITNKTLAAVEADICDVTNKLVMPGVLEVCEVSGKKVLPSELERCPVSGKRTLSKFFVVSSVSSTRLLEGAAISSTGGKHCLPSEGKTCQWSGELRHPDDVRTCLLTGLTISHENCSADIESKLTPLNELFQQLRRDAQGKGQWAVISAELSRFLSGAKVNVESSILSPDQRRLVVCAEVKTMLGFKVRYAGAVYSLKDRLIIGRIPMGKRVKGVWSPSD